MQQTNHFLRISQSFFQCNSVTFPVFYGFGSYARIHGCLGYCGRDSSDQTRIKGLRNDVVFSKTQTGFIINHIDLFGYGLLGQFGKRFNRCHFHSFVNAGGTYIQCTPKDEWKTQYVVHLIGMVRAARSHNDVLTCSAGLFISNFRVWIGHCKNNGIRCHFFEHCWCHNLRLR